MAFLDSLLGPVLDPLLVWSPFWTIVLLSLLYAVYATLIYKFMTNQAKAKEVREKQKALQKKARELRDKPEEAMAVNKEMMGLMKEQMKNSAFNPKVMLATMLPALILFAWMAGSLAHEPIYPGEAYSITATFEPGVSGPAQLVVPEGSEIVGESSKEIIDNQASWRVKSSEGVHDLTVQVGEEEKAKEVLITKELETAEQTMQFEESSITSITINYKKLKPMGNLSIFGWQPGWLGLYIFFSFLFSIVLRKALKVY